MAGLSVAYEALLKGRHVTILDRGAIGSGMTARTTAHLASALDDRYYEFIGLRGEEEARLLYQSLAAAIDRIEQIADTESIDCDFQRCDGYLFWGRATPSRPWRRKSMRVTKSASEMLRGSRGPPWPPSIQNGACAFRSRPAFTP
jgi:glycine/D-amino acid oxidase-like deaminating enzyme